MPLTLEIVTPEASVYADTIDSVVIPTVEGEVGILPGHIALLTQIADGELRVTKNGVTEWLAIGGGFVEIEGDRAKKKFIARYYQPAGLMGILLCNQSEEKVAAAKEQLRTAPRSMKKEAAAAH